MDEVMAYEAITSSIYVLFMAIQCAARVLEQSAPGRCETEMTGLSDDAIRLLTRYTLQRKDFVSRRESVQTHFAEKGAEHDKALHCVRAGAGNSKPEWPGLERGDPTGGEQHPMHSDRSSASRIRLLRHLWTGLMA